MVRPKRDLVGMTFGRLVVIKQVEDYVAPNGKHYARWLCKCGCPDGTQIEVNGVDLTRKDRPTQSCGCLRKDKASESKPNISKPMYNDPSLQLNLHDEHGVYGVCLTSNTRIPFYFDMNDYNTIKDYCWNDCIIHDTYHVLSAWDKNIKKMVKIHHLLGCKNFDHEDKNPLNNRRYNLRPATVSQNNANQPLRKDNKSGIKGLSFRKDHQKWVAKIQIKGEKPYYKEFVDKNDAIKALLTKAKELHGEYFYDKSLFEQYNI